MSAARSSKTLPWKTWGELTNGERFEAVTALIGQGCSAAGVAAKLATTRNAICGFCHRKGITLTGKSGGAHDRTRPKNERSAAGGHATRKKAGVTLAGPRGPAAVGSGQSAVGGDADRAAVAVEPPTVVEPGPVLPPVGEVGFLALTALHCRRPLWPNGLPPALSGMFFCGAPAAAGSSYCRACTARLTAPTPGLIRQRNRTYGAAPSEPAAPAHLPHEGGGFDPATPLATAPGSSPGQACRLPRSAGAQQ